MTESVKPSTPQTNAEAGDSETPVVVMDSPLALLAELTHSCPFQCSYCSNPLQLEAAGQELDTATWCRVMDEAVEMGMHQVHFSGGEPTLRKDIEELVGHATKAGLYSNLITAGGTLLDESRVQSMAKLGLEHVQLSFDDIDEKNADYISGYKGGHKTKLNIAKWVRDAGMPLTINAVCHRQNIHHLEDFIQLAVDFGADRLEVAQVQYYGWALKNRAAFITTPQQLDEATATVEAARERLKGTLVIDYVIPDYYAKRPKVCMGGWARRFMNINPVGLALPCHAAEVIPDLEFDSVKDHNLAWIWENSKSFNEFRGTAWMPEPCRSCDRKELDWGGCRCQAFALTGEAANADPACDLSPFHEKIFRMAAAEALKPPPEFIYRRMGAEFNTPY